MKILIYLSSFIRLYFGNEILIHYKKTSWNSLQQAGFKEENTVAKRYRNTSNNLTLSRLASLNPVRDLKYFIECNKDNLILRKNGRILDIGCGSGAYSLLFQSKQLPFANYEYSGSEVDDKLVKICKERFPSYNFFQAFAEQLPVKDNDYSIVLCSSTLHYVLKSIKGDGESIDRSYPNHTFTNYQISSFIFC